MRRETIVLHALDGDDPGDVRSNSQVSLNGGNDPAADSLGGTMQFTAHAITARRFLALTSALAISACSDDGGLTSPDQKLLANGAGIQTSPSDTTASSPSGEWHLATIRGVLRGVTSTSGIASGDTTATSTPTIAGAKVEIHKFSIDVTTATAGDSAAVQLKDLGIVATVTTDGAGKFQYVLGDPIIVKSGEPSPKITYRLSVTPPAGSPFAAQSGIQVFFMEQFPAGTPYLNYYLFPPRP